MVLMEHPPKQGLKHIFARSINVIAKVLMEHPPKQGLKPNRKEFVLYRKECFNGTSTKTRIETPLHFAACPIAVPVLMEHPPKQGLKRNKQQITLSGGLKF